MSDHSPEDLFQILIAQCEVNYELCRLQSYNPEVLGLVDGVGGPPPSYDDAKNRLDSDKEKLQEALNEEQDRLIKCRQKFDTCEAAVNNVTTPVPTTTTAPPTTTTTTILGTTTTMRVTTARPTTTTSVAEETTTTTSTTTTRDPLLICQDQCIANFT